MLAKPIELSRAPSVARRNGETLYKWGNLLAVIVLDSGEVGQFSTSLAMNRTKVEDHLRSHGFAYKGKPS